MLKQRNQRLSLLVPYVLLCDKNLPACSSAIIVLTAPLVLNLIYVPWAFFLDWNSQGPALPLTKAEEALRAPDTISGLSQVQSERVEGKYLSADCSRGDSSTAPWGSWGCPPSTSSWGHGSRDGGTARTPEMKECCWRGPGAVLLEDGKLPCALGCL